MGRELKRKEAKRSGKSVKEVQKKDNSISSKNLLIILGVLLVLFALTYLLAGIFATKEINLFKKETKETEETNNNIRNRILAQDSLKQLDETYYVYYYDSANEDSEISDVVSKISEEVYRVDLNDDFNANFIGEPSGVVDNLEDLKVKDPTVIKVSSSKIVEYYRGEEIKTSLK